MRTAANPVLLRRGTARRGMPRAPVQSRSVPRPGVGTYAAMARRNLVGPLLIASEEGSPLSGALRLAEAIARRDRVNAHVLNVARPLSSPLSRLVSLVANLKHHELEACRLRTEHDRVRRQVHEAVGVSPFFSTGAELGEPVSAAADIAQGRTAEYILVGVPGLGSRVRVRTEDTVFRLAKAADLPVLAVPADVDRLPRSALVNMDLGEASVRAARATLPLLAAGGSLTLAHVVPEVDFAPADAGGWVEAGVRGVANVLHRLGDGLRLAGNLEVRTVLLQGDPAKVLSELAQDFELTALGAPQRRSFGRFVMESVSADVLRAAEGMVLIVPAPKPGPVMGAGSEDWEGDHTPRLDGPQPSGSPPL
jgi:nucleotide-binding universal stress UspA family protein